MFKQQLAISLVVALVPTISSAAGDVVISQVYGGGGNAGAVLKSDFVELVNRSSDAADLDGWSLQYASATASTWQVTELGGVLQPWSYYLIKLGGGASGSLDLPASDASGATNMSASAGKVALVTGSTSLSGTCPAGPGIQDLVGYGTANCFEGAAAAPAGSNTLGLLRAQQGCLDSNDNGTDFESAEPAPRNQSSAVDCGGGPSSPTETPSAVPSLTPTETPSAVLSSTPTATPEPSASATSTATFSPTVVPATASPQPSSTEQPTATSSPVYVASETATSSPTVTSTPSATATPTAAAVATSSPSPAASATSTPIASPTASTGECGDGEIGAGEQCDDGNNDDGDLCPQGCSYTDSGALVHGNHRRRLARGDGCQLEWYVADSHLTVDPFGFAHQTQSCDDQDPGCDYAPQVGRCRFMVVVCLNNQDPSLPRCGARGITRAEIHHPRDNRAASGFRRTNRIAVEYALTHLKDPADPAAGAIHALPLGAADRNFCSSPFGLDVERRRGARASISLIVDTFARAGERMHRERARLRLVCGP